MQMISSKAGTKLAKEVAEWDDPTQPLKDVETVMVSKALADAALDLGYGLMKQGFHQTEGD
ncbi:hypothetical protein RAN53_09490 [Halomonas sp. SSL-5]|uniref:hypothetical protein n=1 Tax=Halomonas sp. SSL-5 TaxID=3065855 RepID=UPI002739B81B|nr:hypothetical protein [Halomonas sp. SSL-5]MDY7116583.1 hypothetical protein [Halomonas sp. SSL-5]